MRWGSDGGEGRKEHINITNEAAFHTFAAVRDLLVNPAPDRAAIGDQVNNVAIGTDGGQTQCHYKVPVHIELRQLLIGY